MGDDIYDIYEDLPNLELDKECERLQHEVEDLKIKTDQFSVKIDELTKEKNKLIKQKSILLKNISILLKTAKQEIQRKDDTISKLRNELQKYLGNKNIRSCDKKELDNLPSVPPNTSNINERLKGLANSNNKVDDVRKTALCELNRESERLTKHDSYRNQNIRERLGPKISHDRRLDHADRRESDWRREDFKKRQHEEKGRTHEKSYSTKYSRSQKRYSRSPHKFSRSRSRSGSPCAKRRRTSSTGRSRLPHSITPPPKENDVSHHSNSSTHIASFSKENKKAEEKIKSIDDSHQVNREGALRIISPQVSDHYLAPHEKNPDKEEGEMSDSDSFEDAMDEPCQIDQAYLKHRKTHETPKTLFTLRMEQKLRKEDEEKKRAMIQAAANQSDHIDASLFDKPKKVTSDKGPALFSEIFCKGKSDVSSQPPCREEIASKLNEKECSKEPKTDCFKLTKLNEATISSEPRRAVEPMLGQNDCSKEMKTENLLKRSITTESNGHKVSSILKPVASSQSTCGQITELKSDVSSKCLMTIKSNDLLDSSKALKFNEIEHVKKSNETLKCLTDIKSNELLECITKINPVDLSECLKKAKSNELSKRDSNELTSQEIDLQKPNDLSNEIKLARIKPKLHLQINSELDKVRNIDFSLNPVLEAKKTVVETFSPFKDNYKLIELSPMTLSQVKPILFENKPNSAGNSNNIGCEGIVSKNGNDSELQVVEGKQEARNAPADNNNSEAMSCTEGQVIKSPIFNIQKPLKPLSPDDILDVAAVPSSPRKKVSVSPTKPLSHEGCLSEKSENDTTKGNSATDGKSSGVINSVIPSRSLKTYRIPKIPSCESNKCDYEKTLKDNSINDKKRKCPGRRNEAKKSRHDVSQVAEKKTERKDVKKSGMPNGVSADKLQKVLNLFSSTEQKTEKTPKSFNDHHKKDKTLEKKTENRIVDKSDMQSKLYAKRQTVKTSSKKDTDSARSKSDQKYNSGVKGKGETKGDCSKTIRSKPLTKVKVPDRKSLSKSPQKEVKQSRVISSLPEKEDAVEEQLKRLEHSVTHTSEKVVGRSKNSPTEAMQDKQTIESQISISSPEKAPNITVLTPKDNCCDISYSTYRLDEPPPTPDIPYSLLSQIAREKEDGRKNEQLANKLGLDFVESPIGDEKTNISLSRPITPDIPRDLQTSLELSDKSQGKATYDSVLEKRRDNSSGTDRSGDIANFEIFKSVNLNSTSSSFDHSKESKSSTRLQRDLSLSETGSESEDDGSCSSNSDSEASDIMDMFD